MTRFYLQTHAKSNAMIGLCRKFVAFLTKNSPIGLFIMEEFLRSMSHEANLTPRLGKSARSGGDRTHALQGANSGALTAIISKARTR